MKARTGFDRMALAGALAAAGMQLSAAQVGLVSDVNTISVKSDSGYSVSWDKSTYPNCYADKLTYSSYVTAAAKTGYRFLGWYTMASDDESRWGDNSTPSDCTELLSSAAKLTSSTIAYASTSSAMYFSGASIACPKYVQVFSVTASASPAECGSVTIESSDSKYASEGTIASGETCTLKATAAKGYEFKEWQKDSVKVSSSNPYEFTVSAAGAYTAVFVAKEYTVTLSASGGTGADLMRTVTYGEAMPTLSASALPYRTGYAFDGYFEYSGGQGKRYYAKDGTSYRNWDKTADSVLCANWTVNSYTLNLVVNTGIAKIQYRIAPSENWIDATATTSVQVPYGTRWYARAEAQSDYQTSSEVESRMMDEIGQTYSPTATREGYTLTVDPNGGIYLGLKEKTTIHDLRLKTGTTNLNEIGVATCVGQNFLGFWCEDEQVYDAQGHNIQGSYWSASYPDGVFIGTKNMTVEARWGVNYSIAFDANGGSGTMASISNISVEAEVKLPLNKFTYGIRTFAHWTTTIDNVEREFEDGATVCGLASNNNAVVTMFACWNDEYAIGFDGNGATSGKMSAQVFANRPGESQALLANAFTRTDYAYGGWATTKARADQHLVDFVDQQEMEEMPAFATVGATNTIYAVWNPRYTIAFNGNGGEGTMAPIAMVYGEQTTLPAVAFTRDSEFWAFDCWSNAVSSSTYKDCATVSNLTDVAGSTVELIAVWRSKLTDLSLAMGCDNMIWETEGGDWHAIYNYGYDDKSCVMSGKKDAGTSYGLYSSVHTNGTLTFKWKASADNAQITILLEYDVFEQIKETFTSGRSWQEATITIDGEIPRTKGKLPISIYNENSDGVEIYIDQMKWVPVNYAPEPGPEDAAPITGATVENGKFKLSFTGSSQFGYNLLTNGNLSADGWGVSEYQAGADGEMNFEPVIDAKFDRLFYKVETIKKTE